MKILRTFLAFSFFLFPLSAASAQNWNGDGATPSGGGMNSATASLLDSRITQLETQVRQLTNDLEKAQYQNTQLQSQLQRFSQDAEVRFQVIEKMQTQIQDQQQKQLQAAAAQPVALTPPADDATAETEEETKDGKPSVETSAPAGKDAQSIYDDGFNKLRAADYPGAEKSFKQFLGSYSKHQLAGNATYWLGETYYVRGQFKEAAVTFADGYQKYPKNSKAPDNLLKLAMSLASLGSKDDACLTLGELKTKYPNTAPSIRSRADAEKKKLGCK